MAWRMKMLQMNPTQETSIIAKQLERMSQELQQSRNVREEQQESASRIYRLQMEQIRKQSPRSFSPA